MQPFQRFSALELVNQVQSKTSPPGLSCIDGLDTHIRAVLPSASTDGSTLNRGDVFEIQGAAASGKTLLVQFLVMTCILPHSTRVYHAGKEVSVILGGRGKAAVIYDCDGTWKTTRLNVMLEAHIQARISATLAELSFAGLSSPSEMHKTVSAISRESLKQCHIFRPTSSIILAASLLSLPSYHTRELPKQEICMLVIDSLSAFHWQDRWRTEQAELDAHRGPPRSEPFAPGDHNTMQHVLAAVEELRITLGVVTLFTNWGLTPAEPPRGNKAGPWVYFQQHLPAPYPSPFSSVFGRRATLPLTHHITLVDNPSPDDEGVRTIGRIYAGYIRTVIVPPPGTQQGHVVQRGDFEFIIKAGCLEFTASDS